MTAKYYNVRPSLLLGIVDEYTAFCIDEVAAVISIKSEKEQPIFEQKKKIRKVNSLKEFYESVLKNE